MYLTARLYAALSVAALLMAGGHFLPPLYTAGWILAAAIAVLAAAETALLYSRRGIKAERHLRERFSNGDDNRVVITIRNLFPFHLHLSVIDEVPFIFQRRDIDFHLNISGRGAKDITYWLRPARRGEYAFGRIRVFASTRIHLVERRFTCGEDAKVKVYPSYLALKRYEMLAFSDRLTELGIKRIRRPGNNTEFEMVREYVAGDEYRQINWKASARRSQLMTNVYQEERSQQVVCVIDKGRVMQQSFRGMTLLDYAINATLVLSYIIMYKEDKAGMATCCERLDSFVAPAKLPGQMRAIQEALYKQRSTFGETDFSALAEGMKTHLRKRSLLILFTNFADKASMERQLPHLKQLARDNRLLVVFFVDNDLRDFINAPCSSTEDYYQHVIAEKTMAEQRLIVSLLRQNGILSLLTSPENLSVDVINKYLEIRR